MDAPWNVASCGQCFESWTANESLGIEQPVDAVREHIHATQHRMDVKTETASVKCPCGRPFVQGAAFVSHAATVHGSTDSARTLPKIKNGDHYEVPYLTPSTRKPGEDGVIQVTSAGECEECKANDDPALLPRHPNCACKPVDGWSAYIDSIAEDRPTNWTKKQWSTYIDHLRATHEDDT